MLSWQRNWGKARLRSTRTTKQRTAASVSPGDPATTSREWVFQALGNRRFIDTWKKSRKRWIWKQKLQHSPN